MKNYKKVSVESSPRVELHDQLELTGAEISVNTISAKESVPFIHAHKKNEEIYYIFSGAGKAVIDGEEINLKKGDWLKIVPSAKRQFFAANDQSISYICIQVKEHSLEAFTADDAMIESSI